MTARGRTLRRLRLLRGMKQSHLAELVGVTQTTVSRWERGLLTISLEHQALVQDLLHIPVDPAQDTAIRRLVEASSGKVHLICDRTHRLLAASPARGCEWRADIVDHLGRSLIVHATQEILAAEATLEERGWHEGEISALEVETGPNGDPDFRILPGRLLWERIALSDGSFGRLVTTIA